LAVTSNHRYLSRVLFRINDIELISNGLNSNVRIAGPRDTDIASGELRKIRRGIRKFRNVNLPNEWATDVKHGREMMPKSMKRCFVTITVINVPEFLGCAKLLCVGAQESGFVKGRRGFVHKGDNCVKTVKHFIGTMAFGVPVIGFINLANDRFPSRR
jgi:hypothetical protein